MKATNGFKLNTNEATVTVPASQVTQPIIPEPFSPNRHRGTVLDMEEETPYWTDIPFWSDVTKEDFVSQKWQVSKDGFSCAHHTSEEDLS